MDDYDLTIEDCLAFQVKGFGDTREPLGPVMTVAGENFDLTAIEVRLNPIAVVFDFVNPLFSRRGFAFRLASWGLTKPGIGLRGTKLTFIKDQKYKSTYRYCMLDEKFNKERAKLVRDLASRADPFIKRRLMDLLSRYEGGKTSGRLPTVSMNDADRSDSAASEEH